MATPVNVSAKHKVFSVPFSAALANILPDAKSYGETLIVPHTVETTRLARNLGYSIPSPIVSQYDWAGDVPFRTQKLTASMLCMNSRAYVLSEMGTGKTRATLHAVNYLISAGIIERALVVAPLSTLSAVWDGEVFNHFPWLSVGVLHGTKAQRLKVLAEPHHIYVINHAGIEVIQKELTARDDIQAVIVDELGEYRNARTNKWKSLDAFCRKRKYVWGLTGSPMPKAPTDAYAQCKLLTPHTVPKYFREFKMRTMRQITQFRWVEKPEAKDIVYECMQPAVRFTRDDCVELPPVSYVGRQVALSPEQKKVHDQMIAKAVSMAAEGAITAVNEGVLFTKLLQIACGWVYTSGDLSTRKVVDLNPEPRLSALLGVVEETAAKVIVFVDFIHCANRVFDYLNSAGVSCRLVTGETKLSEVFLRLASLPVDDDCLVALDYKQVNDSTNPYIVCKEVYWLHVTVEGQLHLALLLTGSRCELGSDRLERTQLHWERNILNDTLVERIMYKLSVLTETAVSILEVFGDIQVPVLFGAVLKARERGE